MRRILKSKRGISPILATLLLIVIAVAAIIVTYAWVVTFMGAQTGAGGTLMEVENIYWNSTSQTTNISVRNIGISDARIVRLYVGSRVQNLIEMPTVYTNIGTGIFLEIESAVTIVLDWPNPLASSWTAGKTYYFRVVPEVGNDLEFSWKAPSA